MKQTTKKNRGLILAATLGISFLIGFESGGFQTALLQVAQSFELDNFRMGILVAGQFAAMIFMPMIFGRLADRLGKKNVLLAFVPVFAVGCLLAALAQSATAFLLGAVVIGMGYSVCESISSALLADSEPLRVQQNLNLSQCMFSVGAVSGPFAARLMIEMLGGWRGLFGLCCAGGLAVAALLLPVREPHGTEEKKDVAYERFRPGPLFFVLLGALMLYSACEVGSSYFSDSYFARWLGAPSFGPYSVSILWLSISVSRFVFSRLKCSAVQASGICFLAAGAFFAALACCKSAPLALAVCAGLGFALGPIWPLLISQGASSYPHASARVSSFLVVGCGVGSTLAPTMMGMIADYAGLQISFLVLAGLALTAAVLLFAKGAAHS